MKDDNLRKIWKTSTFTPPPPRRLPHPPVKLSNHQLTAIKRLPNLMYDQAQLPSSYQRCLTEAAAIATRANPSMVPSSRDVFDAALLWISSLLASLIIIVACLSTLPFCANANILSRLVARMVVERAPGQNTTSKPAPEGMMKVENWSSNAVAPVRSAQFLLCRWATYHSCKHLGRLPSRSWNTRSVRIYSGSCIRLCSSLWAGCSSRMRRSMD